MEAHSQKFEVKTLSGKLLFSADDNEVVVGAERLRVLGKRLFIKPVLICTSSNLSLVLPDFHSYLLKVSFGEKTLCCLYVFESSPIR